MSIDGSQAMELTVNVHFEEDSYWADVPSLPGCFAAGDTLDELFESLREGIDLCLTDEEGRTTSPGHPLQVKFAVLSDAAA
ncbi:MAG TPA: type II toxin-antitoxin system HicB family antitoxin [Solirubrobacterales bacterium]|jgi:predicted RNase H-like HicB family nuclease|nr:type II toxin-antitoxin system HicB family antitoxin [Solirubrobacterales bacterium]